jgi:hypothetical protein
MMSATTLAAAFVVVLNFLLNRYLDFGAHDEVVIAFTSLVTAGFLYVSPWLPRRRPAT